MAYETEYEELGRGSDLKIPTSVTLTEASNRSEIGRWGEALVYDYLLQQKEQHNDIYDVIWANDVAESGKPYDFEVICTPGDEAYTLFIEVRSVIKCFLVKGSYIKSVHCVHIPVFNLHFSF